MKGTILLNYDDNTRQVEEEEKSRFIRNLLEQCFEAVPELIKQISEIWSTNNILPVTQKIKLREILNTYGLQIIDDLDGHLKVYLENEIIAEWFKCTYKLKRDLSALNPRKRVYIEMEINCWTSFDSLMEEKQTEQQEQTI